jgi:hypothetical protein
MPAGNPEEISRRPSEGGAMHVIFLVHGMGSSKKDEWSTAAKKAIQKYYDPKQYAFLDRYPFKDTFEFCEINYNDLFEEYLDEAKKQADRLGDWNKLVRPIDLEELGVLRYLVDLAGKAPSDSFAVTHLADAALYMATDVGELVKNSIARQISARLAPERFNPNEESWSVIAHSLGTRVMTEVLQAGFTAAPSLSSFGKARLVMMVANTSRLLEKLSPINAGDVYHNAVHPSVNPTKGVCEYYVTATHRLDPVAFIEEFDPPATFGDGQTRLNQLYHAVKLSQTDITSKNIHDLEHYLRHPEVHTTLFRYLLPGTGARKPTQAETKKAMDDYCQETLRAKVTDIWRDSLANLKNRRSIKLKEIFDVWEEFGALIS